MNNFSKHVVYISYDGMTDPLGQSQVIPYIKGLTQQGYSFTLISYEKPERFKTQAPIVREMLKDYPIIWKPFTYHKRFSILATAYDVLIGFIYLLFYIPKHNVSLIHCRSYISSILGLVFKKIYKTKFIFDMRGFWADERVDGGLWNKDKFPYSIVYRFFKNLEKKFIQNADQTIVLTEAGKTEMLRWSYVTPSTPIHVIPCCVDLDLFQQIPKDSPRGIQLKQELGLDNKFILSYLGSIGTWYMLPEMLDFFTVLKKQQPNAVFLFITGDQHQHILQEAIKKGISTEDIHIHKAARNKVAEYVSLSDLSVFFIQPAYSKISSSPTKMAEIMSMGIPIVCNSNVGDVEKQIQEAHAGIVINTFTKETYQEVLTNYFSSGNNYFNPSISIPYTEKNFSLDYGLKIYQNIYHQLMLQP